MDDLELYDDIFLFNELPFKNQEVLDTLKELPYSEVDNFNFIRDIIEREENENIDEEHPYAQERFEEENEDIDDVVRGYDPAWEEKTIDELFEDFEKTNPNIGISKYTGRKYYNAHFKAVLLTYKSDDINFIRRAQDVLPQVLKEFNNIKARYPTQRIFLSTTAHGLTRSDSDVNGKNHNFGFFDNKKLRFGQEIFDKQSIRDYVNEFQNDIEFRIQNYNKKSDDNIRISLLKDITFTFKIVEGVGAMLKIPEEYNKLLYNPRTKVLCFYECLKDAKIELTKSYGEICKQEGIIQTCPIKKSQVKKFLKYFKEPANIYIRYFKVSQPAHTRQEKDNLNKNTFKISGDTRILFNKIVKKEEYQGPIENYTKKPKAIYLLLHLNHFMRMKLKSNFDKVEFNKFQVENEDFDMIKFEDIGQELKQTKFVVRQPPQMGLVGTRPKSCDGLGFERGLDPFLGVCKGQSPYDVTPAFDQGHNIAFYDLEAYVEKGGNHKIYNVGWGYLRDFVNIKYNKGEEFLPDDTNYNMKPLKECINKCVVHYGEDADNKFINDLIKIDKECYERHKNYLKKKLSYDKKYNKLTDREKKKKYFMNQLNFTKKKFITKFYAHNGGRYDIYILSKNPRFKMSDKIIDCNGLIAVPVFSYLLFLDFYRLCPESLSSCCENFNLPIEYSKTEFPHAFASKDTLYYDGPIPDKKYFPSGKIPSYLTSQPAQDNNNKSVGMGGATPIFNFKEVSIDYQKLDVVSLCNVFICFHKEMFKNFKINITDHLTIAGLSISYVKNCMTEEFITNPNKYSCTIQNLPVNDFIRQSIRGGRCFPVKKGFKSSQWNKKIEGLFKVYQNKIDKIISEITPPNIISKTISEQKKKTNEYIKEQLKNNKEFIKTKDKLNELYKLIQDFLEDQDACSLYPSAMTLFKYPIKEGKQILDINILEDIRQKLNKPFLDGNNYPTSDYSKQGRHGIFKIDLHYEKPEDVIIPMISTKGNPYKDKSSERVKCFYTALSKEGIVCDSVLLEEEILYNGAVIDKIYYGIEWEETDFIFDGIKKVYDLRLSAGKKTPLGYVCKLIMNSSYGKFIQRIFDTTTKVIESNEEIDKLILEGRLKNFDILDEGKGELNDRAFCKFTKVTKDKDIKFPAHLGIFILSYSKRIMNRFINAFDGFKKWSNTIYYTDTDSMNIHKDQAKILEEKGYCGKDLGQIHNDLDLDDAKIIESIYICPKVYILKYIGIDGKYGYPKLQYHIRVKGVHGSDKKFTWEDFEEMKKGKAKKITGLKQFSRSIKSDKRGIQTIETSKVINSVLYTGRITNDTDDYFYPIWG